MINRLPKEYAVTDQVAARSSRVPIGGGPAGSRSGIKDRLADAAANSVSTHPVITLGAAFVAGLLLGKLVKR